MKDQDADERRIADLSIGFGQAMRPQIEGISAEKSFDSRESFDDLSPEDLRRMAHDLHRQKTALEMQNAELLRKSNEAENWPDERTIRQLFQDYLRMY